MSRRSLFGPSCCWTAHLPYYSTSHLTNPRIPRLADVSGGFSLYTGSSLKHKEFEMELTLRGHGIALRNLREQVEDKKGRLVNQVYQRPSSERRLEPQKQLLEASGSRHVSPIR